jgi:hypothetical protein
VQKVFQLESGFFYRLLRVAFVTQRYWIEENQVRNGSFVNLFRFDVDFKLWDNLFLCSYPIFLGRQTARIGIETRSQN